MKLLDFPLKRPKSRGRIEQLLRRDPSHFRRLHPVGGMGQQCLNPEESVKRDEPGMVVTFRNPVAPSFAVVEEVRLVFNLFLGDARPCSDDGSSHDSL